MTTTTQGVVAAWPLLGGVGPGRVFVGPVFDYLIVGGGLSLLVLGTLWLAPNAPFWLFVNANLWTLVLLSNSAHFAGSTVRLYTKEGTFRDLPFVTKGLPLVMLAILGLALAYPRAGALLVNVYLLWSPYHYSAQAYGLSVMYACRSGHVPLLDESRWLRLACLLPFVHAGLGELGDFLVPAPLAASPAFQILRGQAQTALVPAAFLVPLAVLAFMARRGERPVPAIVAVLLLSNATWLVFAGYTGAFAVGLVTVFHGLQYLAILGVFHVRERLSRPGETRPWWRLAGGFYLVCLALGYLLFQAWPAGLEFFGATYAESAILVAAVVNLHHFLVDGFIWKIRKDRNYAVVAQGAAAAA
jgi:hypothetical protein